MSYLLNITAKKSKTPQTQPIPGVNQVANSAGGFVYAVNDMVRLRRFICLGSEKGSYYANERKLTAENAACIQRLIAEGKGEEVVNEIVQYSLQGRTAKQDPIIFALAMCVRSDNVPTKKAAYAAVSKVCRIPTFLFTFVQFVEAMDKETSGWGRGMRGAIANWYLEKEGKELAFTITKYKQRNGWSHKDLLRLAHAKPKDDAHQLIFKYLTKGAQVLETFEGEPMQIEQEFDLCDHPAPAEQNVKETMELLKVVEAVAKMQDLSQGNTEEQLCEYIRRFKLAREHLPTQALNSVKIWQTLLEDMPMTAMIRNLAKMTSIGLLQEGNEHTQRVIDRVTNQESLKKARIHPFNVLLALRTYARGQGEKGSLTWNPITQITKALDKAFYLSFKFVEPTGQKVVVGLDVSGSMGSPVLGTDVITCREAAMAMCLVMAKTEPACKMMAFTGELVPLNGVSPDNTLEENLRVTSNLPFGSTDCALPMIWANKNKVQADTFIVYTDNETWAGKIHPTEALRDYRRDMKNPHAKLIVVGMTATEFSIADPNDRGMLDIAGFDSNAPEIMRNFMLGLI